MSTGALEETAAPSAAPGVDGWRRLLDGRLALVALTGVLFALAQLPDPAGYLSTDVGGKTATLEVMLRDGWRLPDLGYWAAEYDPDGSLYPLSNTRQQGDAWVNVTTLPMLLVALPLYALGGMRLAILLPVLGTVAAAAGARRLAVELGGDQRQQRLAFWLVGVVSPATVYALDFWEHSLGLALLVWASVGILRASRPDGGGAWIPLATGVAYGVAASMRQEALVYGFVAGAVLGFAHLRRGRLLGALGRGGLLVAGVGTALVGNALLERFVLGAGRRASRNVGAAQKAGGDLTVRIGEAFESGLAPMWSDDLVSLCMALALAASLGLLAARADADLAEQRVLWLGVLTVYGLLAADLVIDGMRFVPGLLATTPLAAFGAVRGWAASQHRMVAVLALAPLPLVWATQYLGGQSAQWGGRYILTTGTLLVVLGVLGCTTEAAQRTFRAVLVVAVAITATGVGWTIMRTHAFADVTRHLAGRDEPVVIVENSSLGREAGPLALDQTWLAASQPATRDEAIAVLDAAGIDRFAYVTYDDGSDDPDFPGWEVEAAETIPLVNDLRLRITTWAPRP